MAQIDLVEQRLMRAYTYLFLVPADSTGTKSVSLARFGQYEVRLLELEAAARRRHVAGAFRTQHSNGDRRLLLSRS